MSVLLNDQNMTDHDRTTINKMMIDLRVLQRSHAQQHACKCIPIHSIRNPMLVKMIERLSIYYCTRSKTYITKLVLLRTMADNYVALRAACGDVEIPYDDFDTFIIKHVDDAFAGWCVPTSDDIVSGVVSGENNEFKNIGNKPTLEEVNKLLAGRTYFNFSNTNVIELPENIIFSGDVDCGPLTTELPENMVIGGYLCRNGSCWYVEKDRVKMFKIDLPKSAIVGGTLYGFINDTREYKFDIGETIDNMVFLGDKLIMYRAYHKVGPFTIYYPKNDKSECIVMRGSKYKIVPRNKVWICRAMLILWATKICGMETLDIPKFSKSYAEIGIDDQLSTLNAIQIYCAVAYIKYDDILGVISPQDIKLNACWTLRNMLDYAIKLDLPGIEYFKDFYFGNRTPRWWHT